MHSKDIRKAFLEYFREKGHEVLPSSSLVPRHDPTLLFTNAGMVQFKSVFLGEEKRDYKRAATCQKCMRAGGKHSDLENVGHTSRHHTFFEMLGNFSFGDYFKRDAIVFAWELLTDRFRLPKEKLWITIYQDDDEAERLWQEAAGVPGERIIRLGAKDNFWQMGDTGPCGPCSEVLIDQGKDVGCGTARCAVGCDCDRFLELWNLVFMQYNRDEKGNLTPLPSPSIDTGMGIERISAVLQGKRNNFDTDLFSGIISSIESHTGAKYGGNSEKDASIRVIADHMRAAAFLLADGLMPSNEGRGYVLRRIIRRASLHARNLGSKGRLLSKVTDSVVSAMGDVYPELVEERQRAGKILEVEEERFTRTLEQGMKILDGLLEGMRKSGSKTIPGDEAFKLYDTFGFPLDLLRDMAHDGGYGIDEAGFQKAMEAQRERARASWVGEESAVSSIYRELLSEIGKTEFVGYDHDEADSTVRAMLKDGNAVVEVPEGQEAEVFLDVTPFYGESGGQVGDAGSMFSEDIRLEVLDTKRPLDDLTSHRVRVLKGTLKVWAKLRSRVDMKRRASTMRNHTATHLLQAALRSVVGDHVKQAGSLVEPERLRFDFTHFSALNKDEMASIEELVNERVLLNTPVETVEADFETALSSGAMALFGEKYGDRVRVVSVPGFSKEFCGGTHCRHTGEIGPFRILSEGSVASGIRRIEAVTGLFALDRMNGEREELREIGAMLKNPENVPEKVQSLLEEIKELRKKSEKSMGAAMKDISTGIVDSARDVDGLKVISHRVDGLDPKSIRELADKVRDRLGSGVVVLGSANEDQAVLLAVVTPDLTKKLSAGNILKEVAKAAGGKGGGRPDMAQGGTKDIAKLDSALESVYDIVKGIKQP